MFKGEIRSKTVVIEATQDTVWNILYDLAAYAQWNPFTRRVESTLRLGDSIDLYVSMPKRGDRMQQETVCCMDKPSQMAWSMHLLAPWLLSARRDQFIKALGETSCSYETVDVFEGLLAPLVLALFREDVEGGFNAMALALKLRAESFEPKD